MHDLQPYPNEKRERNKKILELRGAGYSFSQIAGLVGGISRQRVHEIFKRSGAERKRSGCKTKRPWPSMSVGDILLYRSASSWLGLYQSAWMWGRRHPNEDGTPKRFRFIAIPEEVSGDTLLAPLWRVERTQ